MNKTDMQTDTGAAGGKKMDPEVFEEIREKLR